MSDRKPVNAIIYHSRFQEFNFEIFGRELFWFDDDGGNDEIIPFSDFAANSIGISGRRKPPFGEWCQLGSVQ